MLRIELLVRDHTLVLCLKAALTYEWNLNTVYVNPNGLSTFSSFEKASGFLLYVQTVCTEFRM